MVTKMTHDAKEACIEALKSEGIMQAGAKAAGVIVRTLNNEMNRSEVFKRRVLAAREEGKRNIADRAIELIKVYAFGENAERTDRNRLTAAIALANAYEPGFRGQSIVQGHIQHDVKIITAVPRPKYDIEAIEVKAIEVKAPLALPEGKPIIKKSHHKKKLVDKTE